MSAPPLQPIVVWFGRVGDMILLSALLQILHRRYGRPCHLVGAGSWPPQLYAGHGDVARVSSLRRYTALAFDADWWRTRAALAADRRSPVYVCETDPKKLARIRRLLRFSGVTPERCVFLAEQPRAAQPPGPAQHWVDRLVNFGRLTPRAVNAADYPWPEPPPRGAPCLTVSTAVRADCDRWLQQQGWSGRTLVLIQPGNRRTMRGRRLRPSAGDDKAWPIERWAQLAQRVHARLPQALIVLCGAPRESLLLDWICAAAHLPALVKAQPSLPRLLGLCARAHSMISVDTGPAHAAAAVGLPLVVMFGGQPSAEWCPRSCNGSPVLALGGPPLLRRLDELSVSTVFDAWCSLLT